MPDDEAPSDEPQISGDPLSNAELDDGLAALGEHAEKQAIELKNSVRTMGTDELYLLAARNYYEVIGKEPGSDRVHRKHAGVLLGIFCALTDQTLVSLHDRYAHQATRALDTWQAVSARMVQIAVQRKNLAHYLTAKN